MTTATPDAATTVRRLLEAFLAGDEAFVSYVDEDFEWNSAEHHPFLARQYRGRQEWLAGAIATVAEVMDGFRFDIQRVLDAGTLTIEVTRVVVDGRVIDYGKTEKAQHLLALDPFTLAVLKAHVEQLGQERRDFGPEYRDHGVLFCWPDGRPPHPDTITRRFKWLAAAAGLSEIDLHDARHSYATPGPDAKIDWKALSQWIGHADVAFTMKQYVQTDLEANRQVANTLAELIIGGSLASFELTETGRASNPSPDGRSRPRQDGRTPFSPWTAPTFWPALRAPWSASWSRSRRCRTV